jgi:hypothetical protein
MSLWQRESPREGYSRALSSYQTGWLRCKIALVARGDGADYASSSPIPSRRVCTVGYQTQRAAHVRACFSFHALHAPTDFQYQPPAHRPGRAPLADRKAALHGDVLLYRHDCVARQRRRGAARKGVSRAGRLTFSSVSIHLLAPLYIPLLSHDPPSLTPAAGSSASRASRKRPGYSASSRPSSRPARPSPSCAQTAGATSSRARSRGGMLRLRREKRRPRIACARKRSGGSGGGRCCSECAVAYGDGCLVADIPDNASRSSPRSSWTLWTCGSPLRRWGTPISAMGSSERSGESQISGVRGARSGKGACSRRGDELTDSATTSYMSLQSLWVKHAAAGRKSA